mmetsp:Transcript_15415/g.19734  ORF Transcript_15415/g.19734 Transcript_15415/m.19734 type:complete len:123 (+) Transcript_15415:733-1101(+)
MSRVAVREGFTVLLDSASSVSSVFSGSSSSDLFRKLFDFRLDRELLLLLRRLEALLEARTEERRDPTWEPLLDTEGDSLLLASSKDLLLSRFMLINIWTLLASWDTELCLPAVDPAGKGSGT